MILYSRHGDIVLTRQSDNVAILNEHDMNNEGNAELLVQQLQAAESEMNGFRCLSLQQETLLKSQSDLIRELHVLLAKQKDLYDRQAVLINDQADIINNLREKAVRIV